MAAIAATRARGSGLVVSGDLHAIGLGRMLRSGSQRFEQNPITTLLAGPIGTRPGGWPSGRRGIGATVPSHLDLSEDVSPIEQHGFTVADFRDDRIDLQMFKWNRNSETVESIDALQPFHTARLPRPS